MKIRKLSAAFAVAALASVSALHAQESSVTTTTASADPLTGTTTTTSSTNTAGTIQEFVPGSSRIVVKTSSGSPVAYTYSKKTTFVDSAGNVVKYESIRAGEPTTVYYAMEAGQPVVSRVVVNRVAPASTATIVEPGTTTTAVVAPAAPVSQTTTSETTTTTTTGKKKKHADE